MRKEKVSWIRLMNLTVTFLIIFLFVDIPVNMAFVKGDINNNDRIDVSDSIYSLQIVAGIRSAESTETINVPSDIPTIQEAIDSVSEGDTIKVASGTYNEILEIQKDNISIIGDGPNSTIIKGNGTESTITINNARGIEIKNLSIQNGSYGVNIYYSSLSCSSITVEQNTRGLRARYNSYIAVDNSFFKDNSEYGIRLNNGSTGYFDNCEITGNAANGMTSDRAASVFIDNSKISNNGATGIQAWLGGNMSGGNNEIKSNGGPGIDISGNSSGNLYGHNMISDNGASINWAAGVTIHHGSYCIISDTDEIFLNQGAGLKAYNNSTADVNGTKIYNNIGNGVNIGTDSTSQFNGAVITENNGYGVDCSGGNFYENQPIDFGSEGANNLNTLGNTNNCN